MTKFTEFEKLSKKKQKEFNNAKRDTWNGLNPVTRKTTDKTKYTRKTKHISLCVC